MNIGSSNGKILAIKLMDEFGHQTLSDSSINLIRSKINLLSSMGLKDRIEALKQMVPLSGIYRTFNADSAIILSKHDIKSL